MSQFVAVGELFRMDRISRVAGEFGKFIAEGDYFAAYNLLTEEAQAVRSPDEFKGAVAEMTTYAPGPIREVEVMEDYILEEWPDKKEHDLAVIYVALAGDGFNEGVTLTLTQERRHVRIRDVEWGRP